MKQKEELPPWSAIIPASIISLAVFYTVYQIMEMLFFNVLCSALFKLQLPRWVDYIAVGFFGVVLIVLMFATLKFYKYLEKTFSENLKKDAEERKAKEQK